MKFEFEATGSIEAETSDEAEASLVKLLQDGGCGDVDVYGVSEVIEDEPEPEEAEG